MATLAKKENRVYEPKVWETPDCPVCGSAAHTPYERFGDRWQYQYVLCRDCQLVYLRPRPRYDADFIYEAYEFYEENDSVYSRDEAGKPQSDFQRYPDDEVLQMLEFDRNPTALLDVGCANGTFLAAAKPHYPKVFGLEVSQRMAQGVENQLGVQVFTQKFEDLDTAERFSCILMSHVIEHIPDPHLWLRKTKTVLAPGGIIVICVPNMFSLSRRVKLFFKRIGLRRGRWEAWRTPDHLYEPTVPSFRKLFEMNGYTVLHVETYSRAQPVPRSFFGKIFHKEWKQGSNLRFIVTPS